MRLDYWLYMNECAGTGDVDTRLGRINTAIRMAKRGENLEAALEECGISVETLTSREVNHINMALQ